jgi:hypothetical protein
MCVGYGNRGAMQAGRDHKFDNGAMVSYALHIADAFWGEPVDFMKRPSGNWEVEVEGGQRAAHEARDGFSAELCL